MLFHFFENKRTLQKNLNYYVRISKNMKILILLYYTYYSRTLFFSFLFPVTTRISFRCSGGKKKVGASKWRGYRSVHNRYFLKAKQTEEGALF